MANSEVYDPVARATAERALHLIESHERVCTERHANISDKLDNLSDDVKGLFSRFWNAAMAIIPLLLCACGALVYLVLEHHG